MDLLSELLFYQIMLTNTAIPKHKVYVPSVIALIKRSFTRYIIKKNLEEINTSVTLISWSLRLFVVDQFSTWSFSHLNHNSRAPAFLADVPCTLYALRACSELAFRTRAHAIVRQCTWTRTRLTCRYCSGTIRLIRSLASARDTSVPCSTLDCRNYIARACFSLTSRFQVLGFGAIAMHTDSAWCDHVKSVSGSTLASETIRNLVWPWCYIYLLFAVVLTEIVSSPDFESVFFLFFFWIYRKIFAMFRNVILTHGSPRVAIADSLR